MHLSERGQALLERSLSYDFGPPRQHIHVPKEEESTEVEDAYPLPAVFSHGGAAVQPDPKR